MLLCKNVPLAASTRNILFAALLKAALPGLISAPAWASFNCDQFEIPELQQLCKRYPDSARFVHSDIPGGNLVQFKNSLTHGDSVHIIPPGRYQLDSVLELDDGLIFLPAPSTGGENYQTIELVASQNYVPATSQAFLLVLGDNSAAAGIEIHAKRQSSRFLESARKGLVQLTSPDAELSASYLRADAGQSLDALILVDLATAPEGPEGENPQVQLNRNLLLADNAETVVTAHIGDRHRINVRNSHIRMNSAGSTALMFQGGSALVSASDLALGDGCPDCTGIVFENTLSQAVDRCAFWSTVSGTAIRLTLTTRDSAGNKGGWLRGNAVSPALEVFTPSSSQTVTMVADVSYQSDELMSSPADPQPSVFFRYIGERGAGILGNRWLNALSCNDSSAFQPYFLQQSLTLQASGVQLFYPPDLLPTCPEPEYHYCIDPNAAINYFLVSEIGTGVILTPIVLGLCYLSGKRSAHRAAVASEGLIR